MSERPQLTVAFGKDRPGDFKNALFGILAREHPMANACLDKSRALGLFSDKDISVDPTTWVSGNTETKLTIGILPMSSRERQALLFEDSSFSYKDEVSFRLSHEICHDVVAYMSTRNEPILNLNAGFTGQRQDNPTRGMTVLAGIAYYITKGPAVQAREDIVELVNMYVWNPDYLQRYLAFLSQADNNILSGLGLRKISQDTAVNLYAIIHDLIDDYLRAN